MIIRKDPAGALVLIRQTDHSRMVGQFAAHWGNSEFAKPRPFDSMVRAAAYHDFGWLNYETNPLMDTSSGVMPTFTAPPPGPAHYAAYQWCNDWMSELDPYAGLLISMHRSGLWRNRHDVISHPQGYNIKTISPDDATFLAKNEAMQRQASAQFDTGELRTNYWMLQVWDLLGLYFCCKDPIDDRIAPVPRSYDGSKGSADISLKPINPRKVAIDPFPFDVRPLAVQLIGVRMPKSSFPTPEGFREAYFQAPIEIIEFELV